MLNPLSPEEDYCTIWEQMGALPSVCHITPYHHSCSAPCARHTRLRTVISTTVDPNTPIHVQYLQAHSMQHLEWNPSSVRVFSLPFHQSLMMIEPVRKKRPPRPSGTDCE